MCAERDLNPVTNRMPVRYTESTKQHGVTGVVMYCEYLSSALKEVAESARRGWFHAGLARRKRTILIP
jgi:hypothetical protein